MHKRAYATVLAASGAVALLVSGCGGGSTPTAGSTGAAAPASTSSTTTAAASPTTTGAPKRDANADLVIWTDADRAAAVTKYAQAFGEENGVTVAVQIATDVRQQFKDATKVGQGPDVIVGAHDWLGELVQNATVAPVNLAPDVTAKLSPNAVAATKFNGQTYGVPYAVENIALMRNTALAPTRRRRWTSSSPRARRSRTPAAARSPTSSSSRSARRQRVLLLPVPVGLRRRHLRHQVQRRLRPEPAARLERGLAQGRGRAGQARQGEGPHHQRR